MAAESEQVLKDVKGRIATFATVIGFPVDANRIERLIGSKVVTELEAAHFFRSTRPIVHTEVIKLIEHFLQLKRFHGSDVEKSFYQAMTNEKFISRLFHNRAICFVGEHDGYILRDGSRGHGGFEAIESDDQRPPLILEDYLSYDEMKLSSLVGLSSHTVFINDGNRQNCGKPMEPNTFEQRGAIVGLVGCRFERVGLMEYQDLVAHPDQNLPKNGFFDSNEKEAQVSGASKQSVELKKLWAKFYNVPTSATYSGAATDRNYVRGPEPLYFNATAYLKRIQITAETLLLEANLRAAELKKQAYVYVVGLGLGVWALPGFKSQLEQMYLDGFGIALRRLKLSHIGTVAFAWITGDIGKIKPRNLNLKVRITKQNPSGNLEGEDKNCLLVVTYAWDGNAFPGNEYWYGSLSDSGDPAAACCSLTSEVQNPMINPFISGQNTQILDPDRDDL